MQARRMRIDAKVKAEPFGLSLPSDFRLSEGPALADPDVLVKDPSYSLYCVDADSPRCLFVKVEKPISPGETPFFYRDQYEHATEVISVPTVLVHKLAQGVELDESRVVFLYSTGRCGSTLISRAFAALKGVQSFSEPDFLTKVTNLRPADKSRDADVRALCKSAITLTCKPHSKRPQTYVLKFRSQVGELSDLLWESFPDAKLLFLYRNALTWLDSFMRSLLRDVEITDESNRIWEQSLSLCHPVLAEYHTPERPMSPACLWTLDWVSSVERYLDLLDRGATGTAARFEDLKAKPMQVFDTLARAAGLTIDDPEAVQEVFRRDAQAGTPLSQADSKQAKATPPEYFEQAQRILATRPRILDADFRVPTTISV